MASPSNLIFSAFYVKFLLYVSKVNGFSYGPKYWNGGEVDFIVVGAGTGGCVVAGRLAESGRHSVLLIEAGGIPHPDLEVPALASESIADLNYYNIYTSIPQTTAGLANNGTITYMHGRILGGSTSVNGLMFNRGSPQDFNNCAELTGDQSWSYSNMLKYFRKVENYTGDYPSDQRGYNGPITVSRPKYAPAVTEWLAAGLELGYNIAEPNGPQIQSFTPMEYSMGFGRRVSSYSGYIRPLLRNSSQLTRTPSISQSKSNLQIMNYSEVSRLIFESERAVGVRINRSEEDGRSSIIFARARKEIILAGGVIGSAVLLQKSGIGPRSLLEDAQIPVIKELPVGDNFQDHAIILQAIILGNSSYTLNRAVDLNEETFLEYLETGDGPYSSFAANPGQAFLSLPEGDAPSGWPNVQLMMVLDVISNITSTLGGEVVDTKSLKDGEVTVPWFTGVTRPKSRGTVTINPRDVDGSPLIDFNLLSHPEDIRALVEGIKVIVRVCEETEAFRTIGCHIPSEPISSCSHFRFRSDLYWECYARWFGSSGLHAAGTCRMGIGSDAVVDTKLRVIGINGLRVADASIMPRIVNTNPQAAVYAIAEKAAEMILETWELSR